MIATHTQQAPKDFFALSLSRDDAHSHENNQGFPHLKNIDVPSALLLPSRIVTHHPKAGLNPLVDAASYLFTMLGKLKLMDSYRQLNKLQKKLVREISTFQESAKHAGYTAEYLLVCRFVICAAFDDIISNTAWGGQGQWQAHSLLAAFNQDVQHQDKFFSILERAIKEPAHYIDLMELIYLCLSLGYKGRYRSTEYSQYQLEQITDNLYKHIRAHRGSFNRSLSPMPLKAIKTSLKAASQQGVAVFDITFITTCIIMTIFISLGYLTDVISNEAYKNITHIENSVSQETIAS